ncbi:MAG TPA: hypothetical protein VFU59_08485 [Candidatus Eisenbacteria bacterium]|nr:hypothetical protein [Candidatus Eisenbacteria bacterium]
MADVMDERIRAIQITSGFGFTAGAFLVALSLFLYPSLPAANETNKILEILSKQESGGWMMLHATLVLGFVLVAIGFTGYGFLLHLKGSSGAASIITACAVIGGTLWAAFLSAEFFVHPFIMNLASLEPGLGTMLFTLYWFWKLGAIALAAVLLFTAVAAAGLAGTSRGLQPVWLGWGGAFFAVLGIVVYAIDFLSAGATGAPINPLRTPFVRFAVGLPLQLWLGAVGVMLMMEWANRRPVNASAGGRRDTVQTTGRAPKASLEQTPSMERQRPGAAPAAPSAPEPPPLPPPIP